METGLVRQELAVLLRAPVQQIVTRLSIPVPKAPPQERLSQTEIIQTFLALKEPQ
ncbi:MAG: hypothetical protein P4L85_18325 [Paludisphaera borealis]|uniref:hypothetical protein n=1 Tax=Paludisphaera borealis TaxID=1387353 RepID=UPI00284A4B53|nr:hypothetical protein [Paludisphaera borealis]MDR3621313.1 hypothetical protein [Paludisphaera borealis]